MEVLAAEAWGDIYLVQESSVIFDPFVPVRYQIHWVENGEASRPFEFSNLGVFVYPHMWGEELQFTNRERAVAPQEIDDRWGTCISRHFDRCFRGYYRQPFRSDEEKLTSVLNELSVYDYRAESLVTC